MASLENSYTYFGKVVQATDAVTGGLPLENALIWAQAAYDYANYYTIASYSVRTSAQVVGRLTNGDDVTVNGNNLLGYPYTIAQLLYRFNAYGYTAMLEGSVTGSSQSSLQPVTSTRSLSRTLNSTISGELYGYSDVSTGTITINDYAMFNHGVQMTYGGSLAATVYVDRTGHYQVSVTGVVDSIAISSGSSSVTVGDLNLNYQEISSLGSAYEVLKYALKNNDLITGTAANELLFGFTGNDTIDGGPGTDTAAYQGPRSAYTIAKSATGLTAADTQSARDGTDTLTGIERLHFSDVNVALDTAGIPGQAYRIYKAAFDRTPDLAGLGFWIQQMDSGFALTSVARGFIASAEFTAMYGANSDNQNFVRLLYNHVLGRDPDQAGYDYWIDQMSHGVNRETVLVNFSESNENIADVAPIIAVGIPYLEYAG